MKTLAAVAGAVLLTAGIVANVGANPEGKDSQVVRFSAIRVDLTKEHLSPDRKWLKAFIPTGSTDKRILVSVNGQWVPGGYIYLAGGAANMSGKFGAGVGLWAMSHKPLPDDVKLALTVAQPGASFQQLMSEKVAGGLRAP